MRRANKDLNRQALLLHQLFDHQYLLEVLAAEERDIRLHDLKEALKLAQQIVILNKGRIEQIGGEQLLQNPATEFVANFFRSQLGA